VRCPAHPEGWRARCNDRDHCEYAPADDPLAAEIYVPRGPFAMGAPTDEANRQGSEGPPHEVTMARGYLIGRYEVTAARYEACEATQACTAPVMAGFDGGGWGLNGTDNGRATHPQNGTSWGQARAFCAWTGGRLPSEAEWERAAAGPWHRRFPWGNAPEADCVHAIMGLGAGGCGDDAMEPVGSRPAGAAACGALDMAGGVWEWVEDCWHGTYDGAPADGRARRGCASGSRILRGGSFNEGAADLRVARRLSVGPDLQNAGSGLRCARDLPVEVCGDRIDNDDDGVLDDMGPHAADDFDDGDSAGWTLGQGQWSVEDGRLVGVGDNNGRVYLDAPYAGDVEVEVDVRFGGSMAEVLLDASGDLEDHYRVDVWAQDVAHDYADSILIWRYRDPSPALVLGPTQSLVPLTSPARLRVRRMGERIELFHNGDYVGGATDPDPLPASGQVGLGIVFDWTVSYDDIEVRTSCR